MIQIKVSLLFKLFKNHYLVVMKIFKRTLFSMLAFLSLAILLAVIILKIEDSQSSYLMIQNQPALQSNSYVIKNVHLIPMTSDTILRDMSVKVVDGKIQDIAKSFDAGEEQVLDAKGGYLSPGLIDMHMHLWDKFELGLYLANGVTTVRSLLGMPFHLEVKQDVSKGELIGPLFFTASPQFTGMDDGDILKKAIQSPEEARKLVIDYKEQGYDYIKTYNLLPKDVFDVVLQQAAASRIPVVAHPSFKVDYPYHFNAAISTIEHTEDIYQQPLKYTLDREKLEAVITGYAASQQTHCPTLTVFYNLTEIYNKGEEVLQAEQAGYINPFIRSASDDYERHMAIREKDSMATQRINEQHRFHLEVIQKLHEAGANIVCGTDAGIVNTAAGFSVHQELNFYLQAGMTNYEALKTATVNPTKVYKAYAGFGTIQKGKMANFILSKENPLTKLSVLKRPEWVMVNGRLIDQARMVEFKQKAYKRSNFLATAIRVFKYIFWGK